MGYSTGGIKKYKITCFHFCSRNNRGFRDIGLLPYGAMTLQKQKDKLPAQMQNNQSAFGGAAVTITGTIPFINMLQKRIILQLLHFSIEQYRIFKLQFGCFFQG